MRERDRAEAGGFPLFEHESASADSVRASSPFSESEEMELAARLLEVASSRTRSVSGRIDPASHSISRWGRKLPAGKCPGRHAEKPCSRIATRPRTRPTGVSPFALEGESDPTGEEEFEAARRFVPFAGAAARRRHLTASVTPAAPRPPLFEPRPCDMRRACCDGTEAQRVTHDTIEPTVSTCDGPTCDEPTIREYRCECSYHRGRRVIVIKL